MGGRWKWKVEGVGNGKWKRAVGGVGCGGVVSGVDVLDQCLLSSGSEAVMPPFQKPLVPEKREPQD
jgi:tRNA U34 5-carboxymethylaminomethyl modifying enzyme MnmG/GidA